VTGAQYMAAQGADTYVGEVLAAQDIDAEPAGLIAPSRLAGIASDGREIEPLLYQPAIRTLLAGDAGASRAEALTVGRLSLDMIVRTQVADAGRAADAIALVARPNVGYVRHVSSGACSRCVVLAGSFFKWNAGFLRHPHCLCVHVPTIAAKARGVGRRPRGYFDSLSPAEQDRTFTRAGAGAIRDGADMGRIVNARRGMQTAGESRTLVNAQGRVVNERHRTLAGPLTHRRRLMPEEIYRRTGDDREAALRLLRQNGYLIAQPTARTHVAARPAPARGR
jgi:hypothetical protein